MPQQRTTPRPGYVPLAEHPGIARRGDFYVVRSPHRSGRPRSFRTLRAALAEQGLRHAGAGGVTSEPFADYATRWIDRYQGRNSGGIDADTRDAYRDAITRLAVPHFKRKPLGKIGPPQMRAYVEHLRDKRKLSAASIRKYVAPLRAMFAELVEDGALPSNPASVRIIGTPDRQPRRPIVLAPKTVEALVAEMPDALRDLILLLALTGLRISEACGLQWRDLTHDERGAPVLSIERQFRNGRYKPKPKTAAGFRTIELAAPLARRLLKRRAEMGHVALSAPIFATSASTPYDAHNVRRALRDAADTVGVDRATPHMLRHSIASLLYERGWTDVQVAALLGHEDPSFTRSRYLHVVERGDVSVLDNVLSIGE